MLIAGVKECSQEVSSRLKSGLSPASYGQFLYNGVKSAHRKTLSATILSRNNYREHLDYFATLLFSEMPE
jgi:hypothetical protein